MRVNIRWQGFLRYKKLAKDARIDIPVFKGDAGYDIHSIEDKIIKAKSSEIVRTGIAIEVEEDYWCELRTRSGMGIKNCLQVHMGTIDSGYREEITVKIYNHGTQDHQIKKGDKIVQLVIHPRIVIPLKEEQQLRPAERGLKGLGSTGR
jgi:dUTP pyrophosphatase